MKPLTYVAPRHAAAYAGRNISLYGRGMPRRYNGCRYFIILMLLLNSVVSASAVEFNVATYNLRQKNQSDSIKGNNWSRRCPVLAKIIQFHEFNIFGTQEGFKDQLEDLKALLPGYDYVGIAREDGKEQGEHSAIFYDTAMFELLDHGDFWLSETPDRPGLGWDAACVRICSWGKFRHRESGKVFQFFNLHMDHVGVTARKESVHLVRAKMQEFGLNLPTFLTGDFNVDQTDPLYEVVTNYLSDAFERTKFRYALNGTFNDYHTDDYSESRIDHIFITDDIEVEKYGVLTDTYRADGKSRVPSDHFPVKIKVKL